MCALTKLCYRRKVEDFKQLSHFPRKNRRAVCLFVADQERTGESGGRKEESG